MVFKDLGPQVPYAVVFLAEYAGPMLCYLPFYFFRSEIYGDALGMKGAAKPLHMWPGDSALEMARNFDQLLDRVMRTGRLGEYAAG